MNKYPTKKLGEISKIIKGKNPDLFAEFKDGAKPYLSAKYIRGTQDPLYAMESDKKSIIITKDDIVIICDGSNSGESFIGIEGILSSTMGKISLNTPINVGFVKLFLDLITKELKKQRIGTAIPHLDIKGLSNYLIPLPPLPTQLAIVARLDEAFARIDASISLIEGNMRELEEMNKSELDRNFENSKYEAKKLGEIAKFIDYRGKTPIKTISGIPLITAKNIRPGYIDENPREYIAEEDYAGWMTRGFPNQGDLAFTTEAPLGNIAEIHLDYKIALAQRVIVFQGKDNCYIPTYLKYHILSPSFQKLLIQKGTGTTVKGIKASVLKEIQIPLPPLSTQHSIVAHLDLVFAKNRELRAEYETQIRELGELRQSILADAFAGRLVGE